MRILYVEDNAANVILVQRIASMGKHALVNYDNGQDALDNFERDAPDCVLMDVQLRGPLDGLEVVRKLRERGCKLPIIALTAYAMKGDRQRCLEAGCDDYLAKPISVTELAACFQRMSDAVQPAKPEIASLDAAAGEKASEMSVSTPSSQTAEVSTSAPEKLAVLPPKGETEATSAPAAPVSPVNLPPVPSAASVEVKPADSVSPSAVAAPLKT